MMIELWDDFSDGHQNVVGGTGNAFEIGYSNGAHPCEQLVDDDVPPPNDPVVIGCRSFVPSLFKVLSGAHANVRVDRQEFHAMTIAGFLNSKAKQILGPLN